MLRRLNYELKCLEEAKRRNAKLVKSAPEGKLRCEVSKGYYQYYLGKEYLGKDKKELIGRLAQNEYGAQLSKKLELYLKKLNELKKLYEKEELEEVYRKLHPARKVLVEPIIPPVEKIIDEFNRIDYEGKPFSEDDKTEFYTIKGERVRSKSEKIIADELYRKGIPYKYEMPIELEGWQKRVLIYPDFTVLNKRTGERWLMEHLGMMDKSAYYENAMQKLSTYEKNGILLGDGLIVLHETSGSPLNTVVLKKYIERYLC